jgi:hypothetical protein
MVVASSAPMSLADRAGLQLRPLRDDFDLAASGALDRNGRKGLEVRGARGTHWVRVQVFDEASGLVLVRCEGDGALSDAGAADVEEILASAVLGEAPADSPDPTPPAWLPMPTEVPLGPSRPLDAGFLASMPAEWRSGPDVGGAPAGVATPPAAIDAAGGSYRIACLPLHEAPTMADLLDRASPIVADESLEPGSSRIGPRVGTVMRSVARIPSSSAPIGARRRPALVRLGTALAGVFRFVWFERAERCVLRYETAPGAANAPEALDRLAARLPEVVRVAASLARP